MLLLRGATILHLVSRGNVGFNTCSSCEEQLFPGVCKGYNERFNTCSSCEEQPYDVPQSHHNHCFNTCSSCEEQPLPSESTVTSELFQYMLLLRGATKSDRFCGNFECSFNTCSSCEEQHRPGSTRTKSSGFNTCSSCEEQRRIAIVSIIALRFQYMLLLRGATYHSTPSIPCGCFNTCSSCEEQRISRAR